MGFVIATIFWIIFFLCIGTVWFGTGYYVEGQTLTIKIGPITERQISIDEIWFAERTYNIISSPANSLKRLKIKYKDGQVLISPTREREFLELIKSINPKFKVFNLQTRTKF